MNELMDADLPVGPFSKFPECRKCGASQNYCRSRHEAPGRGEWLVWICWACGWRWHTKTKDAK